MDRFDSAGVEIAYEQAGSGDPVLLVHGFASSARVNWHATGWVRLLVDAGYRVITIDNRGHGNSEKLYDRALYEAPSMAEDSRRLLDHLDIERADIMGYSMGARITAFLTLNHPGRVRSATLGGLAASIFRGVGQSDVIADGLEAADPASLTSPVAVAFRKFAEQTGGDLKALAACMRAGRPAITPEVLGSISCPVLVVAGADDEIAGPVEPLTAVIAGARGVVLPGRDHMKAVGDRLYKTAYIDFLGVRP